MCKSGVETATMMTVNKGEESNLTDRSLNSLIIASTQSPHTCGVRSGIGTQASMWRPEQFLSILNSRVQNY